MSVTVRIPPTLRAEVGGARQVEAAGESVREVLDGLVERYPTDHVVVYDLLTYAGNRPNLAEVEEGIVFVQADICDRETAERTAQPFHRQLHNTR